LCPKNGTSIWALSAYFSPDSSAIPKDESGSRLQRKKKTDNDKPKPKSKKMMENKLRSLHAKQPKKEEINCLPQCHKKMNCNPIRTKLKDKQD